MPDVMREVVALYRQWQQLDADGDYAEAIGVCDEMLQLCESGQQPAKSAEVCRDISLMKFRFWMDCEAAFQAAIEESPRTSQPWIGRATALIDLERFEEAARSLENALLFDPNSVETLWRLGLAKSELAKDGAIDESLACFDLALKLDRNSESAWYYKAMAFSNAGRNEEALECIEELLEKLNPGNLFAWQLRGIILDNLRRVGEAQECYAYAAKASKAAAGAS